jgi:hypothetical protein
MQKLITTSKKVQPFDRLAINSISKNIPNPLYFYEMIANQTLSTRNGNIYYHNFAINLKTDA